jgi:hypothetical protein
VHDRFRNRLLSSRFIWRSDVTHGTLERRCATNSWRRAGRRFYPRMTCPRSREAQVQMIGNRLMSSAIRVQHSRRDFAAEVRARCENVHLFIGAVLSKWSETFVITKKTRNTKSAHAFHVETKRITHHVKNQAQALRGPGSSADRPANRLTATLNPAVTNSARPTHANSLRRVNAMESRRSGSRTCVLAMSRAG